MNTLKIENTTKEEAIKQINKFRLQNKNKWYQIYVFIGRYKYEFKIYGTWVQIGRKRFSNSLEFIHDYPGNMDINVREFKEYLNKFINP